MSNKAIKSAASLTTLIIVLSFLPCGSVSFAQSHQADDFAIDSSYTRGKKALAARKGVTAITEFSQCLIIQPKNVECHWELGWSFFLTHDYEKAQSAWHTVKRITPKRCGLTKALKTISEHIAIITPAQALRTASPVSFAELDEHSHTLIKIRAVGDTMLGTDFPHDMLPVNNASPLQNIIPLLKGADITFANYEGSLCDGGESQKCAGQERANVGGGTVPATTAARSHASGPAAMTWIEIEPPKKKLPKMPEAAKVLGNCFAFRSPRKFAEFVKDAGFDVISLANNHIVDFGEECRDQTEKKLDDLGIAWSGRQGTIARFERNTIPFSFIAFHSARHTNTTLDIEIAQQMITAEKALGNRVIVSFHGGAEGLQALHTPHNAELFMGENRGDVRRFAHAVVDAGADIVLGSGPHVVRGMEVYKERLIAYSLGNFATYRAFNIWGFNGIGLILEADMDETGRFVSGKIIPTRQTEFGVPVPDEKMIAVDVIRLLSTQDFPNTGIIVAQDGTFQKKP